MKDDPKVLVFDIESDGLLDEATCIHTLVTQDHHSGRVVHYTDNPYPGARPLQSGVTALEDADIIVGHNVQSFDVPLIRKFYPQFRPKSVFDTLTAAAVVWPDIQPDDFSRSGMPKQLAGLHTLKAWGYRLGFHKGEYAEDKTFEEAWSNWSVEMEEYCEQDVALTAKLYRILRGKPWAMRCIALEHTFREAIAWQEATGIGFDVKAANALAAELSSEKAVLEERLAEAFPSRFEPMKKPAYWFTKGPTAPMLRNIEEIRDETKGKLVAELKRRGLAPGDYEICKGPPQMREIPFNPGSRQQIAERLKEAHGWEPTALTPSGQPKIDETVVAGMPYPEAPLLLDYLQLSKHLGQLATGDKSWLGYERNGRIYGRVKTNGAVTGRCTHSNPNIAQVPSDSRFRRLFVATEGRRMVGCDASGLELRCLAHFLARYDDGAYAKVVIHGSSKDGTDVHSTNCRALGMDPTADYNVGGKTATGRNIAKTWIYGFLYGAGGRLLGKVRHGEFSDDDLDTFFLDNNEACRRAQKWMHKSYRKKGKNLTRQDVALEVAGSQMKESFLANLPALGNLIADVEAACERGHLIGLDGRHLPVRSPHAALNTLLQSAGALAMKQALCDFVTQARVNRLNIARSWETRHDADILLVANVHDEVQMEVREQVADKAGSLFAESIRRAGETFNFRCALAGEYDVGDSWADTH